MVAGAWACVCVISPRLSLSLSLPLCAHVWTHRLAPTVPGKSVGRARSLLSLSLSSSLSPLKRAHKGCVWESGHAAAAASLSFSFSLLFIGCCGRSAHTCDEEEQCKVKISSRPRSRGLLCRGGYGPDRRNGVWRLLGFKYRARGSVCVRELCVYFIIFHIYDFHIFYIYDREWIRTIGAAARCQG